MAVEIAELLIGLVGKYAYEKFKERVKKLKLDPNKMLNNVDSVAALFDIGAKYANYEKMGRLEDENGNLMEYEDFSLKDCRGLWLQELKRATHVDGPTEAKLNFTKYFSKLYLEYGYKKPEFNIYRKQQRDIFLRPKPKFGLSNPEFIAYLEEYFSIRLQGNQDDLIDGLLFIAWANGWDPNKFNPYRS